MMTEERKETQRGWRARLFSRENGLALLLCLLLIALLVLTADASPQWIYQGF